MSNTDDINTIHCIFQELQNAGVDLPIRDYDFVYETLEVAREPREGTWAVVKCDPDERGADAIIKSYGVFTSEDEALEFLAEVRDDDPENGNGWTTLEVGA